MTTRDHVEPTPEQGTEWILSGATPTEGAQLLEFHIQHHEEQIRKHQLKLTNARNCLKKIQAEEWPVDDEGRLTLSEDNPLNR